MRTEDLLENSLDLCLKELESKDKRIDELEEIIKKLGAHKLLTLIGEPQSQYNLIYEREDGTKVRGKRLKHVRRIELEDGTSYSHSWASINLTYIGRINHINKVQRSSSFVYKETINGFKVLTKIKGDQEDEK